jgi:hypothetical protein
LVARAVAQGTAGFALGRLGGPLAEGHEGRRVGREHFGPAILGQELQVFARPLANETLQQTSARSWGGVAVGRLARC